MSSRQITQTQRGLLSLAIVVHLFLVTVAVLAGWRRSDAAAKILTSFAPYTTGLNIDWQLDAANSSTTYQVTHGADSDVDYRIEYLDDAAADGDIASWQRLDEPTGNVGESWRRWQRLARAWHEAAADDERGAALAAATARGIEQLAGHGPRRIRLVRRLLPTRDEVAAARAEGVAIDAADYLEPVYDAHLIWSPRGLFVSRIPLAAHGAGPVEN